MIKTLDVTLSFEIDTDDYSGPADFVGRIESETQHVGQNIALVESLLDSDSNQDLDMSATKW